MTSDDEEMLIYKRREGLLDYSDEAVLKMVLAQRKQGAKPEEIKDRRAHLRVVK